MYHVFALKKEEGKKKVLNSLKGKLMEISFDNFDSMASRVREKVEQKVNHFGTGKNSEF